MKTEEQARKTWCPFVRLQGTNCGTYNRADSNEMCIASDCSQWEQAVGIYDKQEARFVQPNESWSTASSFEGLARYEERLRPEGDCGLKRRSP